MHEQGEMFSFVLFPHIGNVLGTRPLAQQDLAKKKTSLSLSRSWLLLYPSSASGNSVTDADNRLFLCQTQSTA